MCVLVVVEVCIGGGGGGGSGVCVGVCVGGGGVACMVWGVKGGIVGFFLQGLDLVGRARLYELCDACPAVPEQLQAAQESLPCRDRCKSWFVGCWLWSFVWATG